MACMEDCHSVRLSRLLALTVLVLNGSLFRNLTLVSYWASLYICLFSSALSELRSSWCRHKLILFYMRFGLFAAYHDNRKAPWPRSILLESLPENDFCRLRLSNSCMKHYNLRTAQTVRDFLGEQMHIGSPSKRQELGCGTVEPFNTEVQSKPKPAEFYRMNSSMQSHSIDLQL